MSPFMQSPIVISVFFASFSSPRFGHLVSLPVFYVQLFRLDRAMPTYSSPISSYNFPTFTLDSSILLLSALLTPMILLNRLFSQSTFPLHLRDMRLSPITSSTFLQAFDSILQSSLQIIYLIFHWIIDISNSELFVKCNKQQRYRL